VPVTGIAVSGHCKGLSHVHFLADEHIPAGVMDTLCAAGHEVVSANFTARVREAAVAGDPLPSALIHYRLDGMGRLSKMARMADAVLEIGNIVTEMVYSVEPARVRSRSMRA
jgi:hypothetical protein